MKEFNSLSGPWVGFSVQFGQRISERMVLVILQGSIHGTGTDKDGRFELAGSYASESRKLSLTRRYIWTTEPSQSGVGVPFEYVGTWDGDLAFGHWHPRFDLSDGGEFEMWPDQDEDNFIDSKALRIEEPLALG